MIDGGSPDAAAVTPESLSPGESRPDTNLFLNEKHADIRSSTTSTSILSSARRFSVLFINAGWKDLHIERLVQCHKETKQANENSDEQSEGMYQQSDATLDVRLLYY